ncbi:MAG: amidohydrolase family protein [Anaerolineae bacterium]|nr:amidohydrolase family protein [Anaerolineae bacterium]
MSGAEGTGSPGFRALLRLLERREDCWVKISSFYRLSDSGPPDYADMKPLAQALVAARPDRCLWSATGRIRCGTGRCRTTVRFSTSSASGCPTRRCGSKSSSRIPRASTASPKRRERASSCARRMERIPALP